MPRLLTQNLRERAFLNRDYFVERGVAERCRHLAGLGQQIQRTLLRLLGHRAQPEIHRGDETGLRPAFRITAPAIEEPVVRPGDHRAVGPDLILPRHLVYIDIRDLDAVPQVELWIRLRQPVGSPVQRRHVHQP